MNTQVSKQANNGPICYKGFFWITDWSYPWEHNATQIVQKRWINWGPNQTAKPVWLFYVFSMEHVLPQPTPFLLLPASNYCTKMFAISSVRGLTLLGCEFSKPHSWLSARLAEDAPLGEGGVDGWPLLWGTTPFCFSLWLESEFSSFSSDFELRNRPPAPLALFRACWCRDSWR